MALISYLTSVPKYKDLTLWEIMQIQQYFDWTRLLAEGLTNPGRTLKEYCGLSEDEIPDKYAINYYHQFYTLKHGWVEYFGNMEYYSLIDQLMRIVRASQIHKWFVDNVMDGVEDTEYHEVTFDQLKELLNLCREVVFSATEKDGVRIADEEIAAKNLPVMSGYEYGPQEYGEFYLETTIKATKCIDKIVRTMDPDKFTIYYRAVNLII